MKSIVILISGRGSNMSALLEAVASGELPVRIAAVISNRADAGGLVCFGRVLLHGAGRAFEQGVDAADRLFPAQPPYSHLKKDDDANAAP